MQIPPRSSVYLSELIGSYILVFTVCGNLHTASLGAALSIGAVLMVMVYALGSVSGAHFNPAVSLGIHLAGRDKMAPFDTMAYIAAQIVGGVCGSFTYFLIDHEAAVLLAPTGHYNLREVLFVEVLYTAALVYVVLNVATTTNEKQGNGANGYFGLAIGFTVVASAIAIGPISGCSLNPAVSVGNMFVGGAVHGPQAFRFWSCYVFAPFGGSLLGSILFFFVQGGMHERFEYTPGEKANAPPKEPTPPVSDEEEPEPPAAPEPEPVPRSLPRTGSIMVEKNEWILVPPDVVNSPMLCGVKWALDPKKNGGEGNIDMDLTCVKFTRTGECNGAVYFAKKDDNANNIHHSGDTIMGDETGDSEFVTFTLADVKPNIHALVFVVTIYSDACFGDISGYHVRLTSSTDPKNDEYCRHEANKSLTTGCNALISAMLYRKGDKWYFRAVDECQKVPPHSSYRRLAYNGTLRAAGLNAPDSDNMKSPGTSVRSGRGIGMGTAAKPLH
jgi:aquaporin Z